MKNKLRTSAIAAGVACALVLAAYGAAISLRRLSEISASLASLGERTDALAAALREESALVAGRMDGIERAIAKEGASNRAGLRSEVKGLDARFSQSLSGVDDLLSDMSLSIDRVGREVAVRSPEAIVGEPGGEAAVADDAGPSSSLDEADQSFSAGRFAEAAAMYGAALKRAPGDANIRLKRAISLYRANPADSSKYSLIEKDLQAVLSGEAGNAQALNVLAMLSIERQSWDKALEYFDRLIELSPNDATILKEAGECALYAGEGQKALAYLDKACQADPSDADAAKYRDKARAAAPGGVVQ
jgi:tetratricopeptide (TPR) repeat protein